ncbi:hypothetical protein MtrunA17_Chr1g0195901 [Medicago truncatula]|uniref:Zinc finger C-x8-C-x5-C-x3-H type family protein n=2 Tax=Medicago truncatula TaxID=3880 RepID=A0A072VNN4_MEDTR|nr:zinc finger C-x8-C-x5-C-x3-H type family protein [Medicago truncatula]RHN81148.1 hypothetical protein MtrunA17_Chr1g0195901 [Medicago truncatula]
MRYNPSASSLIDVPVAPYPVGSLLSNLVPSTSSEFRPELKSGSNSFSARMHSSGNGSGTSVGLIFSQGGSVSLSGAQLSRQSSASLNGSRGSRQSGEIH